MSHDDYFLCILRQRKYLTRNLLRAHKNSYRQIRTNIFRNRFDADGGIGPVRGALHMENPEHGIVVVRSDKYNFFITGGHKKPISP